MITIFEKFSAPKPYIEEKFDELFEQLEIAINLDFKIGIFVGGTSDITMYSTRTKYISPIIRHTLYRYFLQIAVRNDIGNRQYNKRDGIQIIFYTYPNSEEVIDLLESIVSNKSILLDRRNIEFISIPEQKNYRAYFIYLEDVDDIINNIKMIQNTKKYNI